MTMVARIILNVCLLMTMAGALLAQEMVLSEYYNIQDVNSEWTELLVVADNLNVVGWLITDANTGQVTRQGGPQFRDVPLWRNLRAGTIIVLWHRAVPAGFVTDEDPSDGYLELSARDARYFTTYYFAPPSDLADLNIADGGDVLQILRADQSHVHALGHNKPTGAAYNAIPAPKANLDSGNVGASRSNRVTGRTLGAYGIGITKDSVVAGFNDSRGLPNRWDLARTNQGVANINHWFWRETREPKWSATPSVTLVTQSANSNTIEWTALDDPYPQDSTTGYLILRDTAAFSSFSPSVIRDGAVIGKGTRFGSAIVIDLRPTALGRRMTDSSGINCGTTYTYRIYGYRYRRDDLLAVTDDTTGRGRQYTELRWAQSSPITKSNPTKPLIQASRPRICPGDTVSLTTTTVDASRYEWTVDGQPVPVGGTTRIVVRAPGTYRLIIRGDDGCTAISDAIVIEALPAPSVEIRPSTLQTICAGDSVRLTALTAAATYEWLRDGQVISGVTSNTYVARAEGDYQVRIASASGCPGVSPAVRVRHIKVDFSVVPSQVDFGVIGQCKTDTTVMVEIVNRGQSDITITGANLPAGFALVSPAPGFIVPAGRRQQVTLVFAPSGPGTFTSAASFLAQPCAGSAPFSVRGQRTAVSVALNKPGVDFGTYTSCPTSDIKPDSVFCISNSGTEPIIIGVPRVDPPFYLLTDIPGKITIAPGTQFCISILYRPRDADLDRGTIQTIAFPFSSVSCTDTLRARVQAASYRPQAKADESPIDLGVVLSCSRRIDTVISITNSSLVPMTVTNVFGKDILYTAGPIVIDPKSSRSLPVTLDPTVGPGPFTALAKVVLAPCLDTIEVQFDGLLVDASYVPDRQEIDFGDIVLCRESSKSVTFTLAARGLSGLRSRLRSIQMRAPFVSSVQAGSSFRDSLQVDVTFSPSGEGDFTDTLVMNIEPCGVERRLILRGRAIRPRRTTTITSTSFGTIGSAETSTRTLTITNAGQSPVDVDVIQGIAPPFRIVSTRPALPASVPVGGSVIVDIEYSFAGYDRADTVVLASMTTGACADTVRYTLTGSTFGKGTVTGLRVIAPNGLTARAGTDVDIPLELTAPVSLDSANLRAMRIDMSYDPRLIRPDAVSAHLPGLTATFVESSPGKTSINLTSDRPIVSAAPLVTLRARTFVGPVPTTILDVDTAVAVGAVITGNDGDLTVVSDCQIEAATAGLVKPIIFRASNTTDGLIQIEYSVVTASDVTITLSSLSGESRSWTWPVVAQGMIHHASIPLDEFGSGSYVLSYHHGRHVRHLPVMIVR
ncbi:MAG: hypothetical protein FGM33_07045 [Candidatus Kapabacteria bacterium]|nr:hypothetical protein [Candidatus Kapabacteria bacterium]